MEREEKQGYDDYWRGRDLNQNPYERNSESARKWDNGNWDAYDDHKRKQTE